MQASLEQQAAEPSARAERAAARLARADAYADLSNYTFKQRLAIRAIAFFAYLLVKFIGGTTRFKVEGWEHWEAIKRNGLQPIHACWHDRTLLAVYFWRRRGMIVMSSPSFDGECSARFQQHFGYGIVRAAFAVETRSEEHTSEFQSRVDLVCRLLLEKKKKKERHN